MNDLTICIRLDREAGDDTFGNVTMPDDQSCTASTSFIGALAESFSAIGQLMVIQIHLFAEEINQWGLSLRRTADILGEYVEEALALAPIKLWLAYARKAQRAAWRQYRVPIYRDPARWIWRPDFGVRRVAS